MTNPPNTDTERRIEEIYARIPDIRCKGLCDAYCGPILLAKCEALRINARLGREQAKPLGTSLEKCLEKTIRSGVERCSLYDETMRACTIDNIRPAICRIFGCVSYMRCPYGCGPKRLLTEAESKSILMDLNAIGRDGPTEHYIL